MGISTHKGRDDIEDEAESRLNILWEVIQTYRQCLSIEEVVRRIARIEDAPKTRKTVTKRLLEFFSQGPRTIRVWDIDANADGAMIEFYETGPAKKHKKLWDTWVNSSRVQKSDPNQADSQQLWDTVERELWWPTWDKVPLDMYLKDAPHTIFDGSRELRWDIRLVNEITRPAALVPGHAISDRYLVAAIGEEEMSQFRDLCEAWADNISDYLEAARVVRRSGRGEEDNFDPQVKELREIKGVLEALRNSIRELFLGEN